nr:RNA polymerase sigma factor SigF [Streptomyces sp. SID5468]
MPARTAPAPLADSAGRPVPEVDPAPAPAPEPAEPVAPAGEGPEEHGDHGAVGEAETSVRESAAARAPSPAGDATACAPAPGIPAHAVPSASGAPDAAAPAGPGESAEPPQEGAPGARTGRSRPPRSARAADARALTQVLFQQLSGLEPGTPEHARVRAALIEINLPLVRYAAARFRSRNEPMEDVVQVGTIGLINAIDRFDPDRGVQFPTFAMPTVVGEIKRYFRDNVRTVHVPRRLHELWVQVSGAIEDLTVLHGRSPTTAEIAGRLGLSEEEVLACLEAGRAYHATSLEAAQEGDGAPGLLDRLGYEDPELTGVEHRDLVRHLLVQLPERERRILLLRYFGNLTQSQISAELGVSQMHVSRLLSRSFARLRSANQLEP